MAGKPKYLFSTTNPCPVPRHPPPYFVVNTSCIPLHGHNIGGGPLNIAGNSIWPCFSDGSLSRRGRLLPLTWPQIGFYSGAHLWSRRSYRAAGGQGLCPLQLGALVDPQLGMFRVVGGGVRGAEVEGRQPAHGRRGALTLRRVGGGRGVDLRQGGVTAAGAGLLRGPPLRKGKRK